MKTQIPEGLEARYHHARYGIGEDGRSYLGTAHALAEIAEERGPIEILPNGGETLCEIVEPREDSKDGYRLVASGTSRCSLADNFDRKRGRQIALGRALCQLTGEAERRRLRDEEL